VFKSHLWGSPAVVSSDAEVSRAVLQADASSFVPWYPRSLMELMGTSSILVLGGGLQRRVHGLSGAFFKSPQLKARLTTGMQSRVAEAMDGWRRRCRGEGGGAVVVRVQDEAKSVRFLRHALTSSRVRQSSFDHLYTACRSIAPLSPAVRDDVR
jgi:steroid 3-oxidase